MHGKGKYWKAGSSEKDGIEGEWENGHRKKKEIREYKEGSFWV